MRKWYFHSTEAVWEMITREEWLWCRHDALPMFDIPGSTPVWAQYIIFWFSIYKNLCICILFSKSICSIKEHWWFLILSWPDEDQRIFSTTHEILNVKLKPQTVLWWFYTKSYNFTLWHFVDIMSYLIRNSSSSRLCCSCIYLNLSFL